jgi:subtilase family serine protease
MNIRRTRLFRGAVLFRLWLGLVSSILSALSVTASADGGAAIRLVPFARTVHPAVRQSTIIEPVDASRLMAFTICLDWRDRAGAEACADAVSDPNSPRFRCWLTPEEIAERFGPSQAAYDRVGQFLRAGGFRVTNTYRNRLAIRVTGTAERIESVLHTKLRWLREGAKLRDRRAGPNAPPLTFYANVTPVQFPADIAPAVLTVVGLENYTRPHPALAGSRSGRRDIASGFNPNQTRQAYDAWPIYNAGLQGQGRTLGISNWDGFDLSNTADFISAFGLPGAGGDPPPNIVVEDLSGGTPDSGTRGEGEGDLDNQMMIGAAPQATIIIYDGGPYGAGETTPTYLDVLAQEASDNLADILSESYGWGGFDATPYYDQHLTMTMQGQTYLAASGDSGASWEPYFYPAGDPEVLSVGGTELTTDDSGNWLAETAWGYSSGGEITDDPPITNKPSWQVGRGVPAADTGRDFPDISALASGYPEGGVVVYYAGNPGHDNGTSVASPLTAGLLALVEEQMISDGYLPADSNGKQRLGRLAQTLYGFNGRSDVFHDITVGNNGYPCTPYWDYVTGWGSVDMYNLAAALEQPLALSVTPPGPVIYYGQTQQCAATVTGSNVKGVTWSLVSGPGSVDSSTGLYTAPATGTTTQQAVVMATSTIDTATPVTGATTITVAPSGSSLAGTIELEGCSNLAQPITFTLRPASGPAGTQTVTLSSSGGFALSAVPSGTYTVHIKGAKWLASDVMGIVVNGGSAAGANATLLPGDINGDNVVDIQDFSVLAAAFGSDPSTANWNPDADLNCDGVVDINDFSLLAADFGLSGDP